MIARAHRRLAIAAIAGGVIGFFAESVHRGAGVWVLTGGAELPLWIAAVYAIGLFVAGLAFRAIDRRFGAVPTAPRVLAIEAALFVALFLAPPLLHDRELDLTIATVAYAAMRLGLRREPGDLAAALFVVIADAIVELALIGLGLFRYAHADYAPLPLWLAPLWIGLGLSLRRLLIGAGGQGA